jgi:hypothetical protein
MRIFISTGGGVDGLEIKEKFTQVDIHLCGEYDNIHCLRLHSSVTDASDESAYAPDNIRKSSEILTSDTPLGKRSWPVLDIRSLMSSKLASWTDNANERDYDDIVWIISSYSAAVYNHRTTLSVTHRQLFIKAFEELNSAPEVEWKVKEIKLILGFVGFLDKPGEPIPCFGRDRTGT